MTPQDYFVPKLCHKSSMGYVFMEDFWLSELQVSGHMTWMDSLIRTVKNTKLITAILSLSKPETYLLICSKHAVKQDCQNNLLLTNVGLLS